MPREHLIAIDPSKPLGEEAETGHNRWHESIEPVVEVDPGDTVVYETRWRRWAAELVLHLVGACGRGIGLPGGPSACGTVILRLPAGCPSGQRERSVKPSADAYEGSNPSPATTQDRRSPLLCARRPGVLHDPGGRGRPRRGRKSITIGLFQAVGESVHVAGNRCPQRSGFGMSPRR